MKKRRKIIVTAVFILVAAAAAVALLNERSVRDKIVDYWEEQSRQYTAFQKELAEGIAPNHALIVKSISEDKYAYQGLGEEEKQVYDELLYTILHYKEKVQVATLDKEVLQRAFANMSSDYGGLFWISGYSYTEYTRNGEVVALEFAPKYTMKQKEKEQLQRKIDRAAEQYLTGITPEMSDYEKAYHIYTGLIEQVDYDRNASDSQNVVSAFINKKTVCQGYASAVWYLMERLDIPCVIVTGSANGEAHAWNLVQLDGAYYYMDATWGNSAYLDEENKTDKFVNYSYMAFTTEEMKQTHTPDDHMKLPECTAQEDNYFVHEGLYMTEWKPDEIGDLYAQAAEREDHRVSVRYATEDLYDKAKDYFIEQQHLMEYGDITGTVYYLEDKEKLILTISIK